MHMLNDTERVSEAGVIVDVPLPPSPRSTDMTSPLDSGAAVSVFLEAATPASAMEVDAGDPAEPAGDTLPFGSFKIQALRPTVHPPPPRSTGTRIE